MAVQRSVVLKTKIQQSLSVLLLGSQMAVGGAQRILAMQADWLQRKGHRVTIVFFYDKEQLYSDWQARFPSTVITLDAWRPDAAWLRNFFYLARGVLRLFRLLLRERISVFESFTHHSNLIGLPIAWLARVPVRIATHHGRVKMSPGLERIHGLIVNCGLASCLVAVSGGIRRRAVYAEGISPQRVTVIHNGIEPPSFKTQPTHAGNKMRDELQVTCGGHLVLAVGRLAEPKGHIYLLQAVPHILARFPKAIFAIAGDGPLREALHEEAHKLGIERTMRFLGTRSDVTELQSAADVFVLPSISEGLPLALLEAMAMGLPVVATELEELDNVVVNGVTGFLVPTENPDSLAKTIIHLLENKGLRACIGAAAKELVESKYSSNRMCEQYENLFLQQLGIR